jgi:hypothetical protein
VAIDAIAPARVAPVQLRPIASAGTSVEAKSPQPKIPRKATSVPEACATRAPATAIATVVTRPQRSSSRTGRPSASGRSCVSAAAPMLRNELTVLMIAAATPLKTRAARKTGTWRSRNVGVASSARASAGSAPVATSARIAKPTPT